MIVDAGCAGRVSGCGVPDAGFLILNSVIQQ
jgi:hypothetical protein